MNLIEKINGPLSSDDLKKLSFLLDVRDVHFLRDLSREGFGLWVARVGEAWVGVVMVINAHLPYLSEIHSLHVLSAFRHQNIGTALLKAVEEFLKQQGCQFSTIIFRFDKDLFVGSKKFLKKHGWQPPATSEIFYLFHNRFFSPAWLEGDNSFAPPFREVFWKDVPEKERNYLKALEKEKAFPFFVSPFRDEEIMEPLNSLALYEGDAIVGWMITHRIAPEMIGYHAFFIERRLQHSGMAIKMLKDSIKMQINSSVPHALVEVNVAFSGPDWIRFVQKRLAPSALSVSSIQHSWKQLSS